MPMELGDWQLTGYERINRGEHSLQAEDSFVWTYRLKGSSLQAGISMDCPWDKWHDLTACYQGVGWKTLTHHHYETSDSMGFSEISLDRSTGENGLVFFGGLDRQGDEVVPHYTAGFLSMRSMQTQLMYNASLALGFSPEKEARVAGVSWPVTMIQLLCTPGRELNENEQEQLKKLFDEGRKKLASSKRFEASK